MGLALQQVEWQELEKALQFWS
jgi:hypothetical protein